MMNHMFFLSHILIAVLEQFEMHLRYDWQAYRDQIWIYVSRKVICWRPQSLMHLTIWNIRFRLSSIIFGLSLQNI